MSSFIPTAGIMYSGENFDAETSMTGADAIAPDETSTLASAVSEITADEAAISAGNSQIDAAAVAADGLETIAEQVAEANEGEGIDETTAAVIETSVECLLKVARIGVSYKQLGIPSSESFKTRANRHSLGKATVEALDISAKKIWQSIVDAIKKSIEWVRNFFNKIFGAAERLEKRAGALKDSVKNLSGKPEDANIENDGLYNSITVNGSPVTAAQLQSLAGAAKKVFDAQKKVTDEFGKEDDFSKGVPYRPIPADYGFKNAAGADAKRISSDSNVVVAVSDRFPGETVVYVVLPMNNSTDAKGLQEVAGKIRAGSANMGDKKAEGKTLKVLAIDEIRAFAEAVEKFAGEVTGYKRNLTEINNNKTKFIAKLEKYLGKGDGRASGDSKDESEKKARATATTYRKLMDEPAASYASHSIRGMSSALQYAELSARKYEKRD